MWLCSLCAWLLAPREEVQGSTSVADRTPFGFDYILHMLSAGCVLRSLSPSLPMPGWRPACTARVQGQGRVHSCVPQGVPSPSLSSVHPCQVRPCPVSILAQCPSQGSLPHASSLPPSLSLCALPPGCAARRQDKSERVCRAVLQRRPVGSSALCSGAVCLALNYPCYLQLTVW